MNRKQILKRSVGMALSLTLLAAPSALVTAPTAFDSLSLLRIAHTEAASAVGAGDVVLVGSLQDELGAASDWNPADGATLFQPAGNGKYIFTGKLAAGSYDFKIAIGGSWDENYGKDGVKDGPNIALRLLHDHEVTFTYDAATHIVTYDYEDMAEEQAALASAGRSFVVTGTVQTRAGGAKDWDPADKTTEMKDIGNGFYAYTMDLPAGPYFYKISVNGSWAENYGLNGNFDGANVQLTLDKPEKVTFYYNDITHKIQDSHSYKMLKDAELPVLGGDFAALEGDKVMRDLLMDKFYQTTLDVKAGTYTAEIKQKGQKAVKQQVTVRQDGKVSFYYDFAGKKIIVDDGSIHPDKVVHDTWDTAYRAPFQPAKVGEAVKLSIRTQQGDVQNAKLVLTKAEITANGGDEYNPDYAAGKTVTYDMQKTGTEDGSDIWSVTITPEENGMYGYTFLLNDMLQYGDDARPGNIGATALRGAKPFQLTVYTADYHTPDWAKEAITCQIFPDRFFNGDKSNDNARTTARGNQPIQHRDWNDIPANHSKTPDKDGDTQDCNDFFGGDLAGITQKLDYLKDLGITAIYVNPMMSACSNHRYDTVDYGTIDPLLGNMEDFQQLVAEMDKRGMHLIMDGVFNHVGDDSIYFDRYGKYQWVGAYEFWSRVYDLMNTKGMKEAAAKEEARKQLIAEGQVFSPYQWENWFEIKNQKAVDEMGEKYAYHDWQGYSSLVPFSDKDLLNEQSSLGEYLLYGDNAVITKWFKDGLSSWRLDVAKEIPAEFWRNVRKTVKQIKTTKGEEPLLLGEIWQDGTQFLTGDQFDSVMNYKLSFAVGDLFLNRGDAKAADDELKILQQNYPREALYDLMNIVDSHDTVRAIYKFGGGQESVAQATLKDFDYELGKARLKLSAAFILGYPGMPTFFYGDEAGVYGSADPDCRRTYPWGNEDKELIAYYKQVMGVRNAHKQLFAHGDVNTLKAEGDIFAYARTNGSEAAVVALNRGKAQQVVIPAGQFADGTVFADALDSSFQAAVSGGQLVVDLGENQARMMIKK